MRKIFIEKAIIIEAPISKVWQVLTDPVLTSKWIREWWPEMRLLDSDWQPNSPVLWQIGNGTIAAKGTVVLADPPTMLTYSFQATGNPYQETITYKLEERDHHTYLMIMVGDYGDTPDHELSYTPAVDAWEKSIHKIKELAEK